jgi:hypothetical protein
MSEFFSTYIKPPLPSAGGCAAASAGGRAFGPLPHEPLQARLATEQSCGETWIRSPFPHGQTSNISLETNGSVDVTTNQGTLNFSPSGDVSVTTKYLCSDGACYTETVTRYLGTDLVTVSITITVGPSRPPGIGTTVHDIAGAVVVVGVLGRVAAGVGCVISWLILEPACG